MRHRTTSLTNTEWSLVTMAYNMKRLFALASAA